jgi:hypothetical protein
LVIYGASFRDEEFNQLHATLSQIVMAGTRFHADERRITQAICSVNIRPALKSVCHSTDIPVACRHLQLCVQGL